MRRVEAWVTADGAVFTEYRDAVNHAQKRYGDALTALAHEAVRIEKYAAMGDFIEAALPRFQALAAMRNDWIEEPGE